MKNIDHIKRLVQKAQDKSISKGEMDELLQWLEDEEAAASMPEICHLLGVEEKEADYSSQWQKLSDKIPEEEVRYHRIRPMGRWAVAAAVLVLGSVLSVVMLKNKHPESIAKISGAAKDKDAIVPGTKKAILVTGNGHEITLDSSADRIIVQGKDFRIQTNKNGQLVNNITGSGKEVQINTVVTPPGGQYEVILPDGTAATLNAASSIKYPSAFQTDKREVKITGEVYFEVARDARKPFVVSTEKNMQIEVLGTSFNVNAYSNEPVVKTTLLEGAVRVVSDKAKRILKPGDQAQLTDEGSLHFLTNVDVGSVVAWKNGVFEFNGTDIKTVMREISRWYNVDIAYEGNVPADLFSAIINRQNSIDQVLTMLQNTLRVHFSVKNRTIYVSN
ncbi:MAG TPA: FecR domain-containing protein [Puia sp.]|nr:FecR domain-containing protein [Puia sp.]